MNCIKCNISLNESQFNSDRTLKSCPRCSSINGREHVFHRYPNAFVTTDKRESSKNPDGPQSYCVSCRGGHSPSSYNCLCSEIAR